MPEPVSVRNPAGFIFGCPRSGTTLLRRIIDAHPGAAAPPETNWIPKLYRDIPHDRPMTDAAIAALLSYRRFKRMKISRAELEAILAGGPIGFADFVSAIYDLYGARRGKHVVVDKTPAYGLQIPLLHALWPRARFVHLVRDGRDVCLSMRTWRKTAKNLEKYPTWPDYPVATIAAFWRRRVEISRADGAALPYGAYREFAFERLVAAPEAAVREICGPLGLPFDARMMAFNEGRRQSAEAQGATANSAWLAPTPGRRDWRTQLEPQDVAMFEAVAGDALVAFGYELSGLVADPDAHRVAELARKAVAED
ncbi:sulfotransferase [bacterium]|nr:sulfotransferase [bacterium]